MLPGPGPVYTAYDSSNIELHFKLYSCLVAASYIIAVLLIYYNYIYSIVTIFKWYIVWGTNNYNYSYLSSFPSSCIVYT